MCAKLLTDLENFKDSRSGPLDRFIPTFKSSLSEQGYTKLSLYGKMKTIQKFNRWIGKRRITVSEMDKQTIIFFSMKILWQDTFAEAIFQLLTRSLNGYKIKE